MNFDEYDKSDDPHDYKFVRWLTKEKVGEKGTYCSYDTGPYILVFVSSDLLMLLFHFRELLLFHHLHSIQLSINIMEPSTLGFAL